MRKFMRSGYRKVELMDSTANQCYQQAAELSGDLGEYHRAMELYQTVADWSLTSALTKYSVKEYWLRAALCSMAMGVSLFFLSHLEYSSPCTPPLSLE
jgi:alpha-soluble NSF attachment protein